MLFASCTQCALAAVQNTLWPPHHLVFFSFQSRGAPMPRTCILLTALLVAAASGSSVWAASHHSAAAAAAPTDLAVLANAGKTGGQCVVHLRRVAAGGRSTATPSPRLHSTASPAGDAVALWAAAADSAAAACLAALQTKVCPQLSISRQRCASLVSELSPRSHWRSGSPNMPLPPPPPLPPQDPKHTIELVGPTDLERLRIWHGQSVSLGVEVDGQQQLKWVVNNDPDWRSLAEVLPATEVRCGAMLEGRIDGGALLHPPSCGKGLV